MEKDGLLPEMLVVALFLVVEAVQKRQELVL